MRRRRPTLFISCRKVTRASLQTATLVCALLLFGCGGVTKPAGQTAGPGGGTPPGGSGSGLAAAPTFVYVVEVGNNTNSPGGAIESFSMDPNSGTLTPAPGSPFAVSHTTEFMAISPNGAFGYAVADDFVNSNFATVLLVFGFNNGVPTLKQTLNIGTGIGGRTAVDPTGRFVYLAYDSNDFGTSQLRSFAIQSDGTLAQTGAVPIDVNPESIAIDPRGRFLYTSTSVTSKLWGFSISGTDGTLTPVPNSPVPVSHPVPMAGKEPTPINMLIDPAGQRLFAVDNINFVIDVFSIDQNTGAFTPLGTSNPQPPFELFAPVMDPQGRFLYIAAFNTDLITGVSIAGGGASLPTLPGMPVTTSGAPNWSTAIDPSGSFLYSVEDDAVGDVGFLNGYRIQADGALTVLPGTPVKLAQTPFWIVAAH